MNAFTRQSVDHVVVIGAGIGGLACAIDLAAAGFHVTVVERAGRPGGKMREVRVDGAPIDAGPTVLTLRGVFDALFQAAGASLDDHVRLRPLEILARHAWGEDARLDLFADADRTADAVGVFAGAAEAAGYRAFRAEARRMFETLRDTFLADQQTGPPGLGQRIGLAHLSDLIALRPFDTMWSALANHFEDPRLRQLFGRYATYCGSSPFLAPATLMLIAYVEQAGVWTVDGGMQRLADALETLAASLGVAFRYGAHADHVVVSNGRASGVALAGGERLEAQAVVSNVDAAALAFGALGPEAARAVPSASPAARSLSAVTWTVRARTRGFPLVRHNVFFSGDCQGEFDALFRERRLPQDPTIYICAQDRCADPGAVSGPERMLVIVNAPPGARATGSSHSRDGEETPLDERELSLWETHVFPRLQRCGLTVERDRANSRLSTPETFNALFPGSGGALYGRATHGWAAAFRRPGARTGLPGLYLAGGGAHPGAGVPMAALSGRLAAARLIRDRASTSRFRRAAIAGGMSTP